MNPAADRPLQLRDWYLGAGLVMALLATPALAWGQAAPAKQEKRASASAKKAAPAPRTPQRRDPFRSLLVRPEEAPGGQALPPGKRGLVISQLFVNGIILMSGDRIAVVGMPGRNRAYFLRAKDELYDGYVARITEDGVVFREKSIDQFGRPYEKDVVKSISGPGAKP